MSLQLVSQYQEVSPETIYKNYPEFWYCRLFGKYLNIHKRCSNFPACFSQILCETDKTKANRALGVGSLSDRQVRKQLRGGTITREMQRHGCQSRGKKLLLGKHKERVEQDRQACQVVPSRGWGQWVVAWARNSATFRSQNWTELNFSDLGFLCVRWKLWLQRQPWE